MQRFLRNTAVCVLYVLNDFVTVSTITLFRYIVTLLNTMIAFYYSEDKSKFPANFNEEMKYFAKEVFAWKSADNVDKKISECIKQLRDTLGNRKLACISEIVNVQSCLFCILN